MELYFRTSHK